MSGPHFEQLRTRLKRVHAMMVYSYKLQWHLNVACRGVKIGDFWLKQGKLKNSHKGRVVRKFRTRGGVMRKFRTSTIHPPKCKIGFFQMVITSSFQIQITHRLKNWTPDFLSFKKRYGMHNLSSRKCSKNVSNSSKMRCGCNIPVQLCTVVFKRP